MLDLNIIAKPLTALWQFFMTEDRPQVVATIMRREPDAGLSDGAEGVSYVVRLPRSTVQREVFVETSPTGLPDFQGAKFVTAHATGNNFYKVPGDLRLSDEAVPLIVMGAIFEQGRHPQEPVPAFLQGIVAEAVVAADAQKKTGNLGERNDPCIAGCRLNTHTLN